MKTAQQIRQEFITFFKNNEHTFVPSAPVIPHDDPTLLFTNAGMNQFKAIFLGDNPRGLKRAANSQKCMRVSGKHNDLEEVGRDHYHHTFFEMLGNWSFGNYYKKEAIKWAWELLTKVWGLPKDRLFATIHTSDDEALEYWKTETDIPHNRIMRFGDKSNFWEMGETGPCGPCSEIHFDTGDEATRESTFADPIAGVNGENARYRELWNLVFIQYNREKDHSLTPLPNKHVDTGMGFERIVSVIQGVASNYDTDLFTPIIKSLEKKSGKTYSPGPDGTPFRVIADHIRALVFAITDGAFPSNEGRGYVLRRLLRRAFRFGRELGFREPFLYSLTPVVIDIMGEAFPEIGQRRAFVEEVIKSEEERFASTLEQGIERFELMASQAKKSSTPLRGEDVFTLYDTFGFPMDLTRLMAFEKGLAIDEEGYNKLMEQQKTRAREARKGGEDGLTPEGWTELRSISGTLFLGYDNEKCDAHVGRYKYVESEKGNFYLCILDQTPFYAESGGQVGDKGTLTTSTGKVLQVEDTIKWNDLTIHKATSSLPLVNTDFEKPVHAVIDSKARRATRRNHTATHLLQAALRKVLGTHVEQSGSRVDSQGLRFDFTHFKALTDEEIRKVEYQVNEWILDNRPCTTTVQDLATAKKEGATALFGEKYGEKVRVVSIDSVSKELCGGTHVSATGDIGVFHISLETSISAGVRRIEAVTGIQALDSFLGMEKIVSDLSLMLKVAPHAVLDRVKNVLENSKAFELKISSLEASNAAATVNSLIEEAISQSKEFPWVVKDMGALTKDSFNQLLDSICDTIRQKNIDIITIAFSAKVDDKVLFGACCGNGTIKKHNVHCGDMVKLAAKICGGGGGGSQSRAQAGGKDPSKIADALKALSDYIISKK